jgi:hypothetical protein
VAIAGVVFSLLTLASFGLFWSAIPDDPETSGSPAIRVRLRWRSILIPFAEIAFLWFIAVLRDRLGRREDLFLRPCFSATASCSLACCSSPRRSSAPCWSRSETNERRSQPRPRSALRAALLAALGYLLAPSLLIGSSFVRWSFALFPLWGIVAEHPDRRPRRRERPQLLASGIVRKLRGHLAFRSRVSTTIPR